MQIFEKLDTPVIEEYDVIVAGSGPAGSAAAITAARSGAKTLLLECNSCLGGVWTAGQLAWFFEMDKSGFVEEINRELIKRSARRGLKSERYVYEVEEMKLLLEELCLGTGVNFLLYTRVVKAYSENGKLSTVVVENKSGRQAFKAKAFVDATGEGNLSALAGCNFSYGLEDTGKTQPMTYMALITVQDAAKLRDFISFYEEEEDNKPDGSTVLVKESESDWCARHVWGNFKAELHRARIEPSYGNPTLFRVRDNLLALMINHEYGVVPFDAKQMTEATVQGRAEVNRVVKALRSLGGAWQGIALAATCEHIGVREGRRIHGLYEVSKEDLINGARHEDAVVRVNFPVDIHSLDKHKNKEEGGITRMGVKSQPYDIPLRALIAKDVDGLLMAGRCISGDFYAHASYRVTGIAATLGQAAGATAALSALTGSSPSQISYEKVNAAIEQAYPNYILK